MSLKQLITLLFVLGFVRTLHGSSDPIDGNFDCDSNYHPEETDMSGCLTRLQRQPSEYEVCRDDSDTTCFIFLKEPPFVSISVEPKDLNETEKDKLMTPFRCKDHASQTPTITGIAMELHDLTVSSDDYCMWGGLLEKCSFNQLVDFIEVMAGESYRYRFAVTGLLLETPQRKCRHDASTPIVDNSMIIIGKQSHGKLPKSAWKQLIEPFDWSSWSVFGFFALLFIMFSLAIGVRFHVFRGRSLVTAIFFFAGERHQRVDHETDLYGENAVKGSTFTAKYGLVMTLIRYAFIAFVGIFVIFYEVSVVNFLFMQEELSLPTPISKLDAPQKLTDFAVLRDSALEDVWRRTGE